jgi:hypothetical protein
MAGALPLYPRKQTSAFSYSMSVSCQNQTWSAAAGRQKQKAPQAKRTGRVGQADGARRSVDTLPLKSLGFLWPPAEPASLGAQPYVRLGSRPLSLLAGRRGFGRRLKSEAKIAVAGIKTSLKLDAQFFEATSVDDIAFIQRDFPHVHLEANSKPPILKDLVPD